MLKVSRVIVLQTRSVSLKQASQDEIRVLGVPYFRDDYTNVTEKILREMERKLHLQTCHPINLVKQRITKFMYARFKNSRGNPLFSVYDNLSPVVTVDQNFDSLLVPPNHASRARSDCYYVNRCFLLRAHMTAFQAELIRSGLNDFLMIGDVFRRDEIDKTHYPIFHQVDAVRLKNRHNLFADSDLQIFETSTDDTAEKQACHTLEAVKLMEFELKSCLQDLARSLFGPKAVLKWTLSQFPFTHPSWELEVQKDGVWIELLGCGIMRQGILHKSGVQDRIGWAFGLGLERIAMCLYNIPDIRLFWSTDSGFLSQFKGKEPYDDVTYKPVSVYPQLMNDISFWLPSSQPYERNDFYDLVRSVGGDIIEQIILIDEFTNKKDGRTSHCYRIVYRHMERVLTQTEVNDVHNLIGLESEKCLGVEIRNKHCQLNPA